MGQLVQQTGIGDLLKDMISRKLPGLGIAPWSMELCKSLDGFGQV